LGFKNQKGSSVSTRKTKQKLEITWIGKENRAKLKSRILLGDPEKSYHAVRRATPGITVGPAGNGTAGQNPRSTRLARPSRWSGKPVTGQSFRGLAAGRLNGKADWQGKSSTVETRSAQRT